MARRPLLLKRPPATLEPLEGRTLFATLVVDTGYRLFNSLYDTIARAAPGDTVDMRGLSGRITLDTHFVIDKNLTLIGPGSDRLTLVGSWYQDRVFEIKEGLDVTISGLTIDGTSARTEPGGGIIVSGDVNSARSNVTLNDVAITNCTTTNVGGGLYAGFCDLTLNDCRFAGNTSASALSGSGGAMYLDSVALTANDCTFDYNTAHATGDYANYFHESTALGGGVCLMSADTSTFTNCTFANNAATADAGTPSDSYAEAHGGGLFVTSDANLTLINCTMANNVAGGNQALGFGGGFEVLAFGTADVSPTHTLKVANSVFADNTASTGPDAFGLDVAASAFANLKNNIVGNGSDSGIVDHANGNRAGTTAHPIDAMLGALTDNGGPVPTMMPQAGSPLLSAASTAESPRRDARGYPRSGPIDVGAVERQSNYAPGLTYWPATSAAANVPYATLVQATDVDGDAIAFTITNKPAWLTFADRGNGTAALTGIPSSTDGGATVVTVRASDGRLSWDETFTLTVSAEPVSLGSDGVLHVIGTDAAEVIKVWQPRGNGGAYRVAVGKRVRNYSADAVTAIQIFGLGGDDVIVANPTDVGVYVNAGNGNDTVVGSANVDTLTAAAGDDSVLGQGGNDWIDGNGGRDNLQGGDGDDRIYGGNGNDTLDGGAGSDVLYGEVGSNLYLTADRTRDRVFATNPKTNFVRGDIARDILYDATLLV